MVALTGTVIAANNDLNDISIFANAGGTDSWYHYNAVAPTSTRHGSKEFWAKSNDDCATHVLIEPEGTILGTRDFSENEYFYDLESNDDRYIAPSASSPIDGNGIVTYGLYPQTYLKDIDGIYATLNSNAVPQTNGWYKYRGEYYAKVVADSAGEGNYFRDGTTIYNGSTYWFKCDPIVWNKLPSDDRDGSYYLISSTILDAGFMFFNQEDKEDDRNIEEQIIFGNNYKYSEIRAWLNGYDGTSYKGASGSNMNFTNIGFIDTAFVLGDSAIQINEVNNGAVSTDSGSGSCACDNTNDKVFLPSYADLTTGSYGFPSNTSQSATRICKTTDWSLVRHASDDQENRGYYWTRSPNFDSNYPNDTLHVWKVDRLGDMSSSGIWWRGCGVRPAIKVYIP